MRIALNLFAEVNRKAVCRDMVTAASSQLKRLIKKGKIRGHNERANEIGADGQEPEPSSGRSIKMEPGVFVNFFWSDHVSSIIFLEMISAMRLEL